MACEALNVSPVLASSNLTINKRVSGTQEDGVCTDILPSFRLRKPLLCS